MTAQDISRLLAARHSDGVYVPQCKMGAAGSRVLDGWALLPTWSPMTAVGYEIKVSRSDWLKDQKFHDYLAVCHLFCVAAPKGVVHRDELPAGIGLLEPVGSGNGAKLVMRVKPVRREPDAAALSRLMAYALMWRRAEGDPSRMGRARRAEMWRTWVDERRELHRIGRSVSKRMHALIREALQRKDEAEQKAAALAEAAALLAELGVTPGYSRWETRRRIREALGVDAADVLQSLDAARQALDKVQAVVSGDMQKKSEVA